MRDYLDAQRSHALDEIRRMPNAGILSQSVEEWVAALTARYGNPEIPKIYTDKLTHSTEPGEVPALAVPNPSYSTNVPKVQGLIYRFHLPFTGNRNFFHYQPAGWNGPFPGADVLANELLFAMGGAWLKPEDIEKEIDSHVADIERALAGFQADADRFKQDLPGILRPHVTNRYQTAARHRSRFSSSNSVI